MSDLSARSGAGTNKSNVRARAKSAVGERTGFSIHEKQLHRTYLITCPEARYIVRKLLVASAAMLQE
eukprot:3223323-Heterocapsa_arctica.AAC.1